MFNRLSVHIGVIFLLGSLFLLSLSTWFNIRSYQQHMVDEAEYETNAMGTLIAAQLSNDVFYRHIFQIWNTMRAIVGDFSHRQHNKLIAFAVLDGDGILLSHSDPISHPLMKPMPIPTVSMTWLDQYHLVQVIPIYAVNAQLVGYIQLQFDVSNIDNQINAMINNTLWMMLLCLVLSVLIAWGAALRISRPLQYLMRAVKSIGSGEFQALALPRATDEVVQLIAELEKHDQLIFNEHRQMLQSKQMLQSIIDTSPVAIFVKDTQKRFMLVNARFCHDFHVEHDAIEGKTSDELFDHGLAQAMASSDDDRVLSGERAISRELVIGNVEPRYLYVTKSPLLDLDGNIAGVCAVAVDLTEQKQASLQMQKLQLISQQTDEIIVITDKAGVIESVNPAFERVSGYSQAEAIGHRPNIVKSGQHPAEYYKAMWESLAQGKIWRGEFINRNKQGDVYEVMQTITPIHDQGECVGYVSIQIDVTEQRKLQQRLQHADRVESLGVLAGGIAHDFNNLLTAIFGNVSLAVAHLEPESKIGTYLAAIEDASQVAADICKQMLAYSGKGKFEVRQVNLSALMESMGKLIQVALDKNAQVQLDLHDSLPVIDADVAQIQQVVLNLLTNASEALDGKHGRISVATGVIDADVAYLNSCIGASALEPGSYVYLEVSDTGCGMTPEIQEKIFDPFFTTKFTGRGLGMSAMLGIVQGHHGGLRLDSEPGQGTTIKIVFPVSASASQPAHLEHAPKVKRRQDSGTVLLIDDEEIVRNVATAMLENFGYTVLTAEDGVQGVEVYRQHRDEIDLVLLDMTMPNMNGQDCFRALKQINPEVCVILSSGYNEQEAISAFVGQGLAGFIQKPYKLNQLGEKLYAIEAQILHARQGNHDQ